MIEAKLSTRRLAAAVVAALLVAPPLAGTAAAEEVPMDKIEQAVKYRQNIMDAMGGLMGAAVGRLRDGFTFGPELPAVAAGLAAMSADIAALFPEGTDFGESDAKAEVWSDRQGFVDKSTQAADATKAFVEAIKSGDNTMIMQAFKGVGDACKGCHEAYRKDD